MQRTLCHGLHPWLSTYGRGFAPLSHLRKHVHSLNETQQLYIERSELSSSSNQMRAVWQQDLSSIEN